MAFYTTDFDDFGEYNYHSTPYYSTSYDTVPFQYSSSSNDSTTCYDIVSFQDSPSSVNETNGYDIVPFQDSSFYSRYEYTESKVFEYDPNAYNNAYDLSEVNYSIHNFTEPELLEFNPIFHKEPNAYNNAYDPSEVNYSAHNFIEPKLLEYDPIFHKDPSAYSNAYDPEVNYSAHDFSEPKLLEYNPIFHNAHCFSSETRFVISYSNAPMPDDTEFDDYDPTPYDGGYDIAQTYGKPLQPNDRICYPRSVPDPDSIPYVNSSYGSIPSPYQKTENEVEKVPISEPILEKEQPSGGNDDSNVNKLEKPLKLSGGEKSEGYKRDNEEKSKDYDNYGNGSNGKPITQFQGTYNGYGFEGLDLCEGLFGYWPCLDKKIRRECGNCEQVASEENQWKSVADYLFGNYGYYNYD